MQNIKHESCLLMYQLYRSGCTEKDHAVKVPYNKGKGKGQYSSSPRNPMSELRDVTCHMRSHSVICHPTQVNAFCLTLAMQAGTRFTYPGGMEGWIYLWLTW